MFIHTQPVLFFFEKCTALIIETETIEIEIGETIKEYAGHALKKDIYVSDANFTGNALLSFYWFVWLFDLHKFFSLRAEINDFLEYVIIEVFHSTDRVDVIYLCHLLG